MMEINEFEDNLNDEIIKNEKKIFINIVDKYGNEYINEIENKNLKKDLDKKKYINYILKKDNSYTYDELITMDFYDIFNIYKIIKDKKKNKFRKFFNFLFNV